MLFNLVFQLAACPLPRRRHPRYLHRLQRSSLHLVTPLAATQASWALAQVKVKHFSGGCSNLLEVHRMEAELYCHWRQRPQDHRQDPCYLVLTRFRIRRRLEQSVGHVNLLDISFLIEFRLWLTSSDMANLRLFADGLQMYAMKDTSQK